MKISIVGTGYVGLVTGCCLAEIGHKITCIDLNNDKIEKLKRGISPIHEPGIEDLIKKNIANNKLYFSNSIKEGIINSEIIIIAVGTPQNQDKTVNLDYIKKACLEIGTHLTHHAIIVTKSTVPVGTNEYIKETIQNHSPHNIEIPVVSSPEFLKEGTAIQDTFHGDRIIIGSNDQHAANIIKEMYEPLNNPIFHTDIRSAEMIKYASNAFLATKISFINEISNLCDRIGANIDDVSSGMGMDHRISEQFLRAGIGFGGSCFPKDTLGLIHMAKENKVSLDIVKSAIHVNDNQKKALVHKAKRRLKSLQNKQIAVLGLTFKPNTDDMREAASISVINELIHQGAQVVAYDPIAISKAKEYLPPQVSYAESLKDALNDSDAAMIITEWKEIRNINLNLFKEYMQEPLVFDGRNCFDLTSIQGTGIEYVSMGRPIIKG